MAITPNLWCEGDDQNKRKVYQKFLYIVFDR